MSSSLLCPASWIFRICEGSALRMPAGECRAGFPVRGVALRHSLSIALLSSAGADSF